MSGPAAALGAAEQHHHPGESMAQRNLVGRADPIPTPFPTAYTIHTLIAHAWKVFYTNPNTIRTGKRERALWSTPLKLLVKA